MNKRSSLTVLLSLLFQIVVLPQTDTEKILMTVAGREIQSGEFTQMYNKSVTLRSDSDFNNFLEQFIIFKLKVADALAEGYDTTRAFMDELKGYREQLARSYLTDSDIKERLLRKAYQRSLTEINASHVLISCPPGASPADTLAAFKKSMAIRERIISGEPFEQVAKAASDDKSVITNGGNLGYFTVFQMIAPFEDAAFSLDVDSVSMPVRTPYGYHIIMVIDKRPSKGKIRVAHILKAIPLNSDENVVEKAEQEINDIYAQLTNGASFSELAKKYSNDKGSAAGGGQMRWFGAGELIPDFSEAAFSIQDTGVFTRPFKSVYGFHIIKLLDKKAPASYEELKPFLESKISQSHINSEGKKSFVEKLRKEYDFRINKDVYDWFIKNTDTLIIQGKTYYNRKKLPEGNIFSFADQFKTAVSFADDIEKGNSGIKTDSPQHFIDLTVEAIGTEQLIRHENSQLENKYPEFRYLMNEFHDGILLFDISEKKVWNKVQEDTAVLIKYYEEHKADFLSKRAIETKVYRVKQSVGPEKLLSAYIKYSRKSDLENRLSEKFNSKGDTLLTIEEHKWIAGDDPEIDSMRWVPGEYISRITDDGYSIIVINKVVEPSPVPFTEVQPEIITGYQEVLTNEWIKQLKEKFPVKIDKMVLKEVREKLNND